MLKFIVGGSKKDYPARYIPVMDVKDGKVFPVILEFDLNSLKWVIKTEDDVLIGVVQDMDSKDIKDSHSWFYNLPYSEDYKTNDILRALMPISRMPAKLTNTLVNVPETYKKGSDLYFEGCVDI